MIQSPLVSLIVNNYNYDRFLAQAIDSALAQTYPHIEVIVVDDCSIDGSRQIIASYGDRIIPVLHTTNGKQGAAFNSGFAKSQGDIIIFLDSDDYLYPNAVEKIVAAWQPGIAKVHYRLEVVDIQGSPRGYTMPPDSLPLDAGKVWQTLVEQGTYNGVATSGNALSRKALSQVMPIAGDYATTSDDYLSVLIPLYGDVVAIDEPLGAYRIHDSNQWAMTTVSSSRFHRFIQHDLQRCELLQSWGGKLGYDIPTDLYMRSFGRVWSRLSSLRLDPTEHPIPSDSRLQLTRLGIRAIWHYSGHTFPKRIIFSLWFLWVGLMPGFLAKPAIVWLFAPHERPKLIQQLLSGLRSLITSPAITQRQITAKPETFTMHVVIVRRASKIAFSMDVYADNLVAGLKQARPTWQITEIAPKPWWKPDEDPWKSGTGLKKYYERFWNHPKAVSQLEADVFHIIDHTSGHVAYWLKNAHKPTVVTCHDLVQLIQPDILNDQARLPALSMATWKYSVGGLAKADVVIAVSENTKKDIVGQLGILESQVKVIPNGVGHEFQVIDPGLNHFSRNQYCPTPKSICLLNVGSTHQRKNIIGMLHALHQLRARGLDVCLWRVGEAFTPAQQTMIEAQGLNDIIYDLGNPDRTQLIDIYNSADILLAPSLYEGFGLTILEAMACGLPVITSTTSSLPEVAGDSALLVDPHNTAQIVEAVAALYADPTYRQSLGQKGIERAKQFRWPDVGEQVAQVYEALAKGPVESH
jgi:glycosyltransferase involved in cell wall biosynthesis